MKLNNLNLLPLKFNSTQNKFVKNKQCEKYSVVNSSDIFVKAQSYPSFRGNLQSAAKKVLEDKNLTQRFAEFMAAGFTTLTAFALGNSNEFKEQTDEMVKHFLNQEVPNENLKVENDEHIIETKTDVKQIYDNEKDNEAFIFVNFPKKRGRLSKEEEKLKYIVENLKLKKDDANKLTEICQAMLEVKDKAKELYNFDIKFLIDHLGKTNEDIEACAQFINIIYEQYKNPILQTEKDESKLNETAADAKSSENLYRTEGEMRPQKGVTVVGKIKLQATAPGKNTNAQKLNSNDSIISNIDTVNDSYDIRFPGTIHETDVNRLLTKILLDFEDRFKSKMANEEVDNDVKSGNVKVAKKVKFLTSRTISNFRLEKAIIKEIKNHPDYRNISPEDVETLKDVICSEPRLRTNFNLHAALRFIDRTVDFNDNTDIVEQVTKNLDLFFKGLCKAMSQGVKIEAYDTIFKDGATCYGPRIIIEPDKIKNPELFDFAGSTPLIIGLCKNNNFREYGVNKKTSLINTIFFKGM